MSKDKEIKDVVENLLRNYEYATMEMDFSSEIDSEKVRPAFIDVSLRLVLKE